MAMSNSRSNRILFRMDDESDNTEQSARDKMKKYLDDIANENRLGGNFQDSRLDRKNVGRKNKEQKQEQDSRQVDRLPWDDYNRPNDSDDPLEGLD